MVGRRDMNRDNGDHNQKGGNKSKAERELHNSKAFFGVVFAGRFLNYSLHTNLF